MREASRCSGYMSLSGTAPGRPLMINSVSRRGHRQILLATFSRPKTAFPQLMSPFQATRRRNLSLVEPILRDELAAAAPVMPDGCLEPGFGKVGMVAHDDLESWCEFLGEVVQQAEDAM